MLELQLWDTAPFYLWLLTYFCLPYSIFLTKDLLFMHMCVCLWRSEEFRSLGVVVTGDFKPFLWIQDTGILVLRKRNKYFWLLSHLSSPISILIICRCVCLCQGIYTWVYVPKEVRRWHQVSWSSCELLTWMLRIILGLRARAVWALNWWAIHPSSPYLYFWRKVFTV